MSVKGGDVSVNMIRDLHSAMECEKAPIGVFISAAMPTRPMETEAAAVGRFADEWGRTYPRLKSLPSPSFFKARSREFRLSTPQASSARSGRRRAIRGVCCEASWRRSWAALLSISIDQLEAQIREVRELNDLKALRAELVFRRSKRSAELDDLRARLIRSWTGSYNPEAQ